MSTCLCLPEVCGNQMLLLLVAVILRVKSKLIKIMYRYLSFIEKKLIKTDNRVWFEQIGGFTLRPKWPQPYSGALLLGLLLRFRQRLKGEGQTVVQREGPCAILSLVPPFVHFGWPGGDRVVKKSACWKAVEAMALTVSLLPGFRRSCRPRWTHADGLQPA